MNTKSKLGVLSQHRNFKKSLVLIFVITSSLIWFSFWFYGRYYLSTDDAYLNANVVQIAPRITGQISNLHIHNNQYVKKDELLIELDPKPFQIAVDQAKAQLKMNQSTWKNALLIATRVAALVKKKYSSQQEGDNAITALENATAAVDLAKANLAQAELNLKYTQIYAPISGWVTNLGLREGDITPANQSVFALISDEEFWVDANFKETELEIIHAGMSAVITTDLYPHHPFQGVVESISNGTGTVFSLLPPQNATGNWVKITQRIPVRVRILDADATHPLRIGTSSTVTIHIHG